EKPHLPYWLKNRGIVLYGRDIRDEIELPHDPSSFLEIHLQRIKHCIRNWVLEQLSRKNHKAIVKEMERQVKYLMATALLSKHTNGSTRPTSFRNGLPDASIIPRLTVSGPSCSP